MTENEKRRQMGELLLDHIEAQKHLAHLQEKAIKMRERLAGLMSCLEPPHVFGVVEIHDKSAKIREWSLNSEFKDLDFDAVASLVQEMEDAQNKVDHFADRKSALGL
jgi:hypothetical protein